MTDVNPLVDTTQTWFTRPAQPDDRPRIESLYREFCEPDDEFLDVALDEDHDDTEYNQMFVAEANGRVVGFGAACRASDEWLSNCLNVGAIEHRFDEPNGYFHTCCVAPEWRGRGVATELGRARLKWLRSHGAEPVFGVSWIRDDGPSSAPVFERLGFEELAHVQEFYYIEEDVDGRRWCPDCGEPCRCSAKIYGRKL